MPSLRKFIQKVPIDHGSHLSKHEKQLTRIAGRRFAQKPVVLKRQKDPRQLAEEEKSFLAHAVLKSQSRATRLYSRNRAAHLAKIYSKCQLLREEFPDQNPHVMQLLAPVAITKGLGSPILRKDVIWFCNLYELHRELMTWNGVPVDLKAAFRIKIPGKGNLLQAVEDYLHHQKGNSFSTRQLIDYFNIQDPTGRGRTLMDSVLQLLEASVLARRVESKSGKGEEWVHAAYATGKRFHPFRPPIKPVYLDILEQTLLGQDTINQLTRYRDRKTRHGHVGSQSGRKDYGAIYRAIPILEKAGLLIVQVVSGKMLGRKGRGSLTLTRQLTLASDIVPLIEEYHATGVVSPELKRRLPN